MKFLLCVLSVIITSLPQNSLGCGGYEYKHHYLKPCTSDNQNVIQFKDASNRLDANCNIIPLGCMKTDGFKSAMIHYRVEKKPMPIIEGDFDFCEGLKSKDELSTMVAKLLGLPDMCPVGKLDQCGDGKKGAVSVAKYKSKFGLAVGVTVVNLTIKHDNGETCLTMKTEIKKARKMG